MEHVSTLCAISTVGIAATGFALGRAERAQFLEPQHAPLPATYTTPLFFQNNDSRPSKTFATAETESPVTAASFSEARENAALYTEQTEDGIFARRKTSFAGVRLRRRGQTLTLPPLRTDDNTPTSSHTRRPSSSWIRRLSFQPDKRFSLQTPDSPSFPEPASPASSSSRPSSQRRAPNKLVKRPKSQHSNANPFFAHTVSSPSFPSALRRPATSYQRSETSKHKATHSLSFEPSLALNTVLEPTSKPPGNDDWRPYISPSSDTLSERMTRRFSTATKPRDPSVRRILPHTDTAPTLLLATSIAKKETATEVAIDPSVEFRDPFKESPQNPEKPLGEQGQSPPEEPCPKSPADDAAPLDIRVFRNGSFAGPKRRAASTPLPNMPNVEGAIWVSPRAPGRRNITDPNVFRRPPTTSDVDIFSSGIVGRKSKVVSSYRKEYSADLGSFRYRDVSRHTSTDLYSLRGSLRRRPKRHSLAASDPASTVIGSDDTRIFTSGDEDDTDFLSDTAFDSIRTHMTTDSSCFQSPRIETIFDRTFPPEIVDEPPARQTLPGSFVRPSIQPSNLESQREAPLTLVTRNLAEVHEGDSQISFPSDLSDDEDSQSMVASLPGDKTIRPSLALANFGAMSLGNNEELNHSNTPNLAALMDECQDASRDTSPRMNIFDWSEQSRADREGSGPDGRPRTVHGKHGPAGIRGSRATGRKAPNTLHYRSQSVPVAREPVVLHNESRQTSGKFGTWGLGSKGVSEDWDSDFEFEDNKEETTMSENVKPNKETNRQSVVVPQAIMERQASLHGQFGQVQELTLLVEELKRLRHQASFLNIVRGPSSELWKEAEGIVDLATLDDDDDNDGSHSPPRSPTSLTFSFDDSEVESSNMNNDPWKRASGESWRASLSENTAARATTSFGPDLAVLSTKTNSVLDLIYHQRLSQDPTVMNPSHLPRSKKLPFDTQSLRDLVVRAGVVTRALKEVVRKAEGVTNGSEENTRPSHPPFSRIFEHPSHDDLSNFETSCVS
ncbi:hypothetical protein ASPCAL03653 [Aspergillus calidoustus]|uniref:Uncharacterized protein n=1 Tax=Aspergillus calidoustus TaxID=454130 RepID=A0A0U5FT41_ASPCI|nr:hypothetical protein ASPCAL03653 [Aspergillus calidoustus]